MGRNPVLASIAAWARRSVRQYSWAAALAAVAPTATARRCHRRPPAATSPPSTGPPGGGSPRPRPYRPVNGTWPAVTGADTRLASHRRRRRGPGGPLPACPRPASDNSFFFEGIDRVRIGQLGQLGWLRSPRRSATSSASRTVGDARPQDSQAPRDDEGPDSRAQP